MMLQLLFGMCNGRGWSGDAEANEQYNEPRMMEKRRDVRALRDASVGLSVILGRVAPDPGQSWLAVCSRLLVAALAGWAVLAATELVLLFGVLRLFSMVIGPELLPSLKVVLDMAALAACGWIAGRVGRPRSMAAAVFAAAGVTAIDLTPYVPLNVPWLLRLTANAFSDSRYVSSWLTTLMMHALMFGGLLAGAYRSRPTEPPIGLGVVRGESQA